MKTSVADFDFVVYNVVLSGVITWAPALVGNSDSITLLGLTLKSPALGFGMRWLEAAWATWAST
eukprot:2227357-Pyramimonas_sp.AAC.1